jgi:hypothetical protein
MKKTKNIKKMALGMTFAVLALSSIFMTIETATSGVEIASLQKQEVGLQEEKRSLEESLVKSLSLGDMEDKSVEMGYTKPAALVYVAPPETVAKLP